MLCPPSIFQCSAAGPGKGIIINVMVNLMHDSYVYLMFEYYFFFLDTIQIQKFFHLYSTMDIPYLMDIP